MNKLMLSPVDLAGLNAFKIKNLRQEELYLLFAKRNWNSLNTSARLEALQEIENRNALRFGRPPCTVEPKDFSDGNMCGYFDGSCIVINSMYITEDSLFHTSASALDTVLHEGRHAYQHYAMGQEIKHGVHDVRLEWLGCFLHYFEPPKEMINEADMEQYILYQIQPIETDARRFAWQELNQIANVLSEQGEDIRDFETTLQQNLQQEILLIQRIREHLSLERIDLLNKEIAKVLKNRFPQLDLSELRLFEGVRLILTYPSIDTIQDLLDLFEKLQEIEGNKLISIQDTKLNHIAEKIQDKQAGGTLGCKTCRISSKAGLNGGKLLG